MVGPGASRGPGPAIFIVAYAPSGEHSSFGMKKVRIIVTAPGATPSQLKRLKASLVRQGVEVDEVLDAIGTITGTVAKSQLASLDVGAGATVELGQTEQLPPPNSPLQ